MRKNKEGKKKIIKTEPKDVGHFLVSSSVDAQSKMSLNMVLVERKACCHVANAFLSGLDLIWLMSILEISETSKKLQESMG